MTATTCERYFVKSDKPCRVCGQVHGVYTTGIKDQELCGVPILWNEDLYPLENDDFKICPLPGQRFVDAEYLDERKSR